MSSSELLSPIMMRTGSPVSWRMKKTTVTTQKTTITACHKRRRMYCPTVAALQESGGEGERVRRATEPAAAGEAGDAHARPLLTPVSFPPRLGVPVHLVGPHHLVLARLPVYPVVDAVDVGQGVHEERRAVGVEDLLSLLVVVEALLLVQLVAGRLDQLVEVGVAVRQTAVALPAVDRVADRAVPARIQAVVGVEDPVAPGGEDQAVLLHRQAVVRVGGGIAQDRLGPNPDLVQLLG